MHWTLSSWPLYGATFQAPSSDEKHWERWQAPAVDGCCLGSNRTIRVSLHAMQLSRKEALMWYNTQQHLSQDTLPNYRNMRVTSVSIHPYLALCKLALMDPPSTFLCWYLCIVVRNSNLALALTQQPHNSLSLCLSGSPQLRSKVTRIITCGEWQKVTSTLVANTLWHLIHGAHLLAQWWTNMGAFIESVNMTETEWDILHDKDYFEKVMSVLTMSILVNYVGINKH